MSWRGGPSAGNPSPAVAGELSRAPSRCRPCLRLALPPTCGGPSWARLGLFIKSLYFDAGLFSLAAFTGILGRFAATARGGRAAAAGISSALRRMEGRLAVFRG